MQCHAKSGRGGEGHEAERVDEHDAAHAIAALAGKACGYGAAERVTDEHGGRRAGPLDQLVEPGEHAAGVEWSVRHLGAAVPWKVGSDHTVRARERRQHRGPVRRVGARAVEQNQRRAPAPLEDGRGDAGEREPPLGHG